MQLPRSTPSQVFFVFFLSGLAASEKPSNKQFAVSLVVGSKNYYIIGSHRYISTIYYMFVDK